MPLTKISAPKHLPMEKVRALANAVQEARVETCKVPPDDLFQTISRFEADELIMHPSFEGMQRSADACIVEIPLLGGRTDDQKRALYRVACEKAVAVGFRADDLMIALIENSRVDWSLGNGLAYADVAGKA
jgi:hypothetical protein